MTDLTVVTEDRGVALPLSDQFTRVMKGWLGTLPIPANAQSFLDVVVQMAETNVRGMNDATLRMTLAQGLSVVNDFRDILAMLIEGVDSADTIDVDASAE